MSNKKITQVHNVNPEELAESISTAVEKIFAPFKERFQPQKPTEWKTRKQVGEILSISLVTVDDWTRKNLLTAYRISNKKRYKLSEVENALTKINN
ncbi:helix-turn-helix domain-containing protein [Polaribacter sp. IC073]|uniref:helix-turn-helix domain-containing protein n=1 Tax=Polaribacter sp. IC073 TaxID=2508540 RepID=UPI0011BDBC09|nr:helix-turn-helix domain-containing protein [Polaribacter sp. IC073]TXD49612.1 helix-turn-helix domain-containing protein [Polaribacter sp. IC073]